MSSNQLDPVTMLGAFGLIIILLISVFMFGHRTAERTYQSQARDRGYAEHDSQTGEWKWIEPDSNQ